MRHANESDRCCGVRDRAMFIDQGFCSSRNNVFQLKEYAVQSRVRTGGAILDPFFGVSKLRPWFERASLKSEKRRSDPIFEHYLPPLVHNFQTSDSEDGI